MLAGRSAAIGLSVCTHWTHCRKITDIQYVLYVTYSNDATIFIHTHLQSYLEKELKEGNFNVLNLPCYVIGKVYLLEKNNSDA